MSRTRTLGSLALGALASAAYLAVVARGMSLEALAQAFASVDPLPCALYVAGFAVVMRARAERLAASLTPLRPTRAIEIMPSQMAGYLANFVLPMQAGELARIAVAVRGLGVPAGAMVSAMALERVVDLLFALAALALAAALLPAPSAPVLWQVGLGIGTLVAVALGGIAWATLRPAAVRETVAAVAARLPEGLGGVLRSQADACCDGLATLRDPIFLVRYLGWSVLQWLGWVASVAATLHAAGIEADAATTVLCSALATLALALPAAPGYVGTFQLAYHWALAPAGVDASASFVAATLLQVLTIGCALLTAAGVALAPRISRARPVPPAAPRGGPARSTREPAADPRACGRRPRGRP